MGKKHRRPEPHRPGSPIQQAIALHQANRFPEAEAIYRSLSQDDPHVLQLLGVLLCQTARPVEGLSTLERAVEQGPNHVEALSNLGVAYCDAGRLQEALALFERAVILDPKRSDLFDKRGFILQGLSRHEEAIANFRLGLENAPQNPDIWFHLGNSLQVMSDLEGAEAAFRKALQAQPTNHETWFNLGNALGLQGKKAESLDAYRRSADIRPTAQAYHGIAVILSENGDRPSAIQAAKLATQLEPTKAARHAFLGDLYETAAEAIPSLKNVVQLDPGNPDACLRLAVAMNHEGRYQEAQGIFTLIAESTGASQMTQALLSPVIPMSVIQIEESRQRSMESLASLRQQPQIVEDAYREVGITHFGWSYHSESELELQRSAVEAYRKVSPNLFWESPYLGEKASGKIRLGVVCGLLNRHTIGRWFRRLILGLQGEDIEVVFFDSGRRIDDWTLELNSKVHKAIRLTNDFFASREVIAEQRLDALFYPEIGLNPLPYYMAFSRLAPLQFTTVGHPASTGLPSMDCFLSSEDLEHEGSEENYSERLVKLPTLPAVFDRPQSQPITRIDLGLPEDKRIYACPQTSFKLHPDFDRVLAEILRRDSDGLVVLVTGLERLWDDLLRQRFQESMPDVSDRIVFLERLSTEKYLGLCANADALLDTFYFGGSNSSLDAFSVGGPVVTWPGKLARGRGTFAQYRAMGIEDLIAQDPNHYIELALQVAKDKAWNRELKAKILERNEVLYDNTKPIDEWKTFLKSECSQS